MSNHSRPTGLPCRHATPDAPICDRCQRNRAKVAAWALANPKRLGKRTKQWARKNRAQRRISQRAYELRNANREHARKAKYRAKLRGAVCAPGLIDLANLYRRDNGICQLCGYPVESPGTRGIPLSARASIDHTIPLSKGGPHEWENVRLAHVGCNSRRGNSPPADSPPFVYLPEESDECPRF